jgi:8-oxo-dGTP pyrophosphatase MutT (NUDIX family)
MSKDTFPGAWDSSSSGHVDSGEQYDACAARELREELGLVVESPPRRLFKVDACPETDQEFVWVYRVDSEGPFTLHPEEIDAGGWFSPTHLGDWIKKRPGDFASALILIWEKLTGSR